MATQTINSVALWGKDPVTQDCDYFLLPGISTDANNAIVADAAGNLFAPAVSLDQELFGAGETLTADAGNSVTVTLTDGSTAIVAPGGVIPANVAGCIAYDEVSNKAAYIGVDTNTFGTVAPATVAGTSTNGVAYVIGDPIVTFPDNTTWAGAAVSNLTITNATAGDGIITLNPVGGAPVDVVTDVCEAMGDVPASPIQLCYV